MKGQKSNDNLLTIIHFCPYMASVCFAFITQGDALGWLLIAHFGRI